MQKAPTYTEQLAKIRVGFLIKDILDRANLPIANQTESLYMYSGHGRTMANVMHTLNMFQVSEVLFLNFNLMSKSYRTKNLAVAQS